MKKLLFKFLLLGVSTNLMSTCTCRERNKIEPPYPTNVRGWHRYEEQGVSYRGNFLLKVGKSTTDGKIQVKVINLIPADNCGDLQLFTNLDRVTLQFIRMSDKKILCEDIFGEKSSISISAGKCGNNLDDFNIIGIFVVAINMKENWVFFELFG